MTRRATKKTRSENLKPELTLEQVCDMAIELAEVGPFLAEAVENEIATTIFNLNSPYSQSVEWIRKVLRERMPNNWCAMARRAQPAGPSAVPTWHCSRGRSSTRRWLRRAR
jgi:hypothetical protein